jgi:hypothetical protein
MSDLTILYYTANRLTEPTAARIRAHLWAQVKGRHAIVSVSQKPIDFGRNICVGDIGANKYNAYWQILRGVMTIQTEYVATVDDDALYTWEHFSHRPPPGEFWYETNYWFCQDGKDYYWRPRDLETKGGGMWSCIARTDTLSANLQARFEHFPTPESVRENMWWGEPGIREGDRLYGRRDGLKRICSEQPCVVFVHTAAMGYTQLSRFHRRYGPPPPENVAQTLPGYGTVADLRREFWSERETA